MLKYFDEQKNFDFIQFIKVEEIIMKQWEDMDEIKKLNERDFINKVTLYNGHIIDELKEVLDTKNADDFIDEVCDVAMYLASLFNLFQMKSSTIEYENETFGYMANNLLYALYFNQSSPFQTHADYIQTFNIKSFYDVVCKVVYNLSGIREQFPQRKWHKPYKPFTNLEYFSAIMKSSTLIASAIYLLINFLIYYTDGNVQVISDSICKKQYKIVKDAFNGTSKQDNDIYYLKLMLEDQDINKELAFLNDGDLYEELRNIPIAEEFYAYKDHIKNLEEEYKDNELFDVYEPFNFMCMLQRKKE